MDQWNGLGPKAMEREGFTTVTLPPHLVKDALERTHAAQRARAGLTRDRSLGESLKATVATQRTRKDQKQLSSDDQKAFKAAVQKLVDDGSYEPLITIHADMSHNMHGSMGPVGLLRFLGWHRRYILEFERLLMNADQALRPNGARISLPYWNWVDPFPEWLQNFLPARRPDTHAVPPKRTEKAPPQKPAQADVNYIVKNFTSQLPGVNTDDYTRFSYGLEGWGVRADGSSLPAHNHVHDWTGGIMSNTSYSPTDPVFWLHHAEVDRLWRVWQQTNAGAPALNGSDRTMDPWPETYDAIADVTALGYDYDLLAP